MFRYLCVGVLAQSVSTPSPSHSNPLSKPDVRVIQSETEQNQTGTKSRPFVVDGAESTEDAAEKRASRDHRKQEANNSSYTTIFTGLLFAVAIVQAGLFIWQLLLMQVTAKDTATAAKAAQASVNLARAGERAYLFVESVAHNAKDWRQGRAPFEWSFRITNHGRTPAIVTEISAFTTISDGKPTANGWDDSGAEYASFHTTEPEVLPPSYVLSQGASSEPFARTGDRGPLIRGTDLPESIKQERERLYVRTVGPGNYFWLIGHVKYRDTYGEECISRFCFGIDQPFLNTVSEKGGEHWNRRT